VSEVLYFQSTTRTIWNPTLDAKLEELAKLDKYPDEIADELDITISAVRNRLIKIGVNFKNRGRRRPEEKKSVATKDCLKHLDGRLVNYASYPS